ncbi:hypothetical protein GEV33_009157 [Tenebrio molitor]|uniref:Transmembrane protein n=1 Tax=Tenebrio molitor TaxID=7067 RepID=A0A8J6LAX7_TENMO|nr:hypothetical protein GEV33_009157 [Tenebrio molitor]
MQMQEYDVIKIRPRRYVGGHGHHRHHRRLLFLFFIILLLLRPSSLGDSLLPRRKILIDGDVQRFGYRLEESTGSHESPGGGAETALRDVHTPSHTVSYTYTCPSVYFSPGDSTGVEINGVVSGRSRFRSVTEEEAVRLPRSSQVRKPPSIFASFGKNAAARSTAARPPPLSSSNLRCENATQTGASRCGTEKERAQSRNGGADSYETVVNVLWDAGLRVVKINKRGASVEPSEADTATRRTRRGGRNLGRCHRRRLERRRRSHSIWECVQFEGIRLSFEQCADEFRSTKGRIVKFHLLPEQARYAARKGSGTGPPPSMTVRWRGDRHVTECTAIIGRCRLTVGVLRRAKGALRGRKSDSRAALRPRVSVNNLIAVECINGLFDRCRNVRRGPRRGGGRANFGRTGRRRCRVSIGGRKSSRTTGTRHTNTASLSQSSESNRCTKCVVVVVVGVVVVVVAGEKGKQPAFAPYFFTFHTFKALWEVRKHGTREGPADSPCRDDRPPGRTVPVRVPVRD